MLPHYGSVLHEVSETHENPIRIGIPLDLEISGYGV